MSGMFARTRNPNYLGEILLYLSFAILTGNTISYAILITIWCTLFALNMICKDRSLRRKAEWKIYEKQSSILLPRFFTNDYLHYLFYVICVIFFYYDYQFGGYIGLLKIK